MARNTTLIHLLDGLRAASRLSLNAASNIQVRDSQVKALQLKQDWFWGDFAWPHLRVDRDIELQAGQRYYEMPDDMDIDRISHIQVRSDSLYRPLSPGIDARHYAAYDSDLDQRGWPVCRWKIVEDQRLEVWPVPNSNFDETTLDGRMRITGIRTLAPLVADTDRADLDDQLLIKSCAADYLAATGAKDAQIKLDEANRLYVKLRAQLQPRKKITIGRTDDYHSRVERIPIAVYNKPSS